MKCQKVIKSKYRKSVYHKTRITTKKLYSNICKKLEMQIKIFVNSAFGINISKSDPDRLTKLLKLRLEHKYLNTAWGQAGNYPKEITNFLINR